MRRAKFAAAVGALLRGPAATLVAPAMRVQSRVAVRTHHAQVLEPIVGRLTIDVIEDERHAVSVPDLALPAELADRPLELFVEEPSLQRGTMVRRAPDQDRAQRSLRRTTPGVVRVLVEVVRRDPPDDIHVPADRLCVTAGRSQTHTPKDLRVRGR